MNKEKRISTAIMSALEGLDEVNAVGSLVAVALGILDARQSHELTAVKHGLEDILEELQVMKDDLA
jgi:hypothetical protein